MDKARQRAMQLIPPEYPKKYPDPYANNITCSPYKSSSLYVGFPENKV